IIRHQDYEMQNHSNDIALIRMDKPINFAGNESHLKPACLDLNGLEKNLDSKTRCVAAGFGDSGSPLQCFINNNWIQIGIAWSETDCEQNPTVYQKIYKYADFIRNTSSYELPASCN
ncbi:transmembrane protease serine 5-like isoform X7, partial [Dinothrombium tinctorium]